MCILPQVAHYVAYSIQHGQVRFPPPPPPSFYNLGLKALAMCKAHNFKQHLKGRFEETVVSVLLSISYTFSQTGRRHLTLFRPDVH